MLVVVCGWYGPLTAPSSCSPLLIVALRWLILAPLDRLWRLLVTARENNGGGSREQWRRRWRTMAAALENNGENNGVDGSRHCCCHVPAIVLDTLGVKKCVFARGVCDFRFKSGRIPRVSDTQVSKHEVKLTLQAQNRHTPRAKCPPTPPRNFFLRLKSPSPSLPPNPHTTIQT